jgi:hypothetical protein
MQDWRSFIYVLSVILGGVLESQTTSAALFAPLTDCPKGINISDEYPCSGMCTQEFHVYDADEDGGHIHLSGSTGQLAVEVFFELNEVVLPTAFDNEREGNFIECLRGEKCILWFVSSKHPLFTVHRVIPRLKFHVPIYDAKMCADGLRQVQKLMRR